MRTFVEKTGGTVENQAQNVEQFLHSLERCQGVIDGADFEMYQTGDGDWILYSIERSDISGNHYSTVVEAFHAVQDGTSRSD